MSQKCFEQGRSSLKQRWAGRNLMSLQKSSELKDSALWKTTECSPFYSFPFFNFLEHRELANKSVNYIVITWVA